MEGGSFILWRRDGASLHTQTTRDAILDQTVRRDRTQGPEAPPGGGQSHRRCSPWRRPSRAVEEAVELQRCSLAHGGLQLGGGSVAQLLDAAPALQQSHGLDAAQPGHLLHRSQDQGVQQPEGRPPAEGVLPAVHLESIREKVR